MIYTIIVSDMPSGQVGVVFNPALPDDLRQKVKSPAEALVATIFGLCAPIATVQAQRPDPNGSEFSQ